MTDAFKLDSSEEACVTKWHRFFKKSCRNVYVVCKCSVYMYSHVYECRHACTMAPVGRSEDNYGYQSKTIHVFLRQGLFIICQISWPGNFGGFSCLHLT